MSAVGDGLSRLLGGLAYVGWLTGQVIWLSVRLGADVLTPGLQVRPRIVKLPLRVESDVEMTLLASSITITPGTLVLGVAPATASEPRALFVQSLYGSDQDEVLDDLADMERRLLRMTRGRQA